MEGGSRILVIGGTGYIGKFIVKASAASGHPTFALVRDTSPSDPARSQLLQSFTSSGVTLLRGSLEDHESLLEAIKQVDVIISAVGNSQIVHQSNIIAAIKQAGNVKIFPLDGHRTKSFLLVLETATMATLDKDVLLFLFLAEVFPSEFGIDVDRQHAVEPAKSLLALKVQIRRAIEAEGIPRTYVCCGLFAGYILPNMSQPGLTSPPRDKIVILGDGNPKAVFNKEEDIATYTIKAVDDPRTLNKVLYMRPPADTCSFNELTSLWEKKIGKTLDRIYVPEDQILKNIEESPFPMNIVVAIAHSVFVKGDQTNFEVDESFGVEASELYPDVKYTTVDEYLNHFV